MVRELLQCQHARVQTEAVFADFLQLSSAARRQYQPTANSCQLIGHMLSYPTWRTSYPRHLTLQNICDNTQTSIVVKFRSVCTSVSFQSLWDVFSKVGYTFYYALSSTFIIKLHVCW